MSAGQFDVSKLRSSSLTPGLQDIGVVSASATIASQTLGIGASLTTSISLTFPQTTNTLSLIRINVSGGHLGNYWFPVMGSLGLSDALTLSPLANGYYMLFLPQGTSSGRTVKIEVTNETVGASFTLPTLTFTAYAHMYSFPWS